MNPSWNLQGNLKTVLGVLFLFLLGYLSLTYYDPIENTRKNKDERLKEEIAKISRSISFYSQAKNQLPWATLSGSKVSYPGLPWTIVSAKEIGLCEDIECLKKGLVQKISATVEGEIKISADDQIYVGKGVSPQDKFYVCFLPGSKAYKKNTSALYQIDTLAKASAPSRLEFCLDRVTWKDEDVCYYCY